LCVRMSYKWSLRYVEMFNDQGAHARGAGKVAGHAISGAIGPHRRDAVGQERDPPRGAVLRTLGLGYS
jgi:hypothetical protein